MKSGECPKCGDRHVISVIPGEYVGDSYEIPMTATADPRWLTSGRNPRHGHGQFVVYICRSCGFAEWYVQDPQSIPIGEEYRTRSVPYKVPRARRNE